jgi:DNA-binding response OmpR family regulator
LAHILVIEDDDQVRDMLQETLEDAGYEVVVASDGADGITHFREKRADLVITDILMPIVNGVEAIRELRKDVPDLKIILDHSAPSKGSRRAGRQNDKTFSVVQRLGYIRA